MKIPRFHLSTLALGCVLAGSLTGLYLRSNVWQLERSSYVDPNWGIQREPGFEWLTKGSFDYQENAITRGGIEKAVFTTKGGFDAWRCISIYEDHGNTVDLVDVLPLPNADVHPTYGIVLNNNVAMRYSPDGEFLAVWMTDQLNIYRRTRAYGWRGYLQLPLFWVAAVCFVLLCANPIRLLLGRKTFTDSSVPIGIKRP
jgi:hypothetical protein